MIESKKLNMWLVLLIILLSAFNVSQVIAQEDFVVIIGEDKVFTEYNYHDAWFEDDPNNPEPWPEQREAYSEGNAAYVSLSANPGHAGVAQASVGVEFQWDLGQYAWEEVKDWPVNVTIDFSYQIEAYWVEGNGSANAGVNIPDSTGPWYDFIGYETGQAGSRGDTVSETYESTIENLGTRILLQAYCQTHSVYVEDEEGNPIGTTHYSFSEVIINSIRIEFECDFSTETGIERCFGGIGTQCEGDVPKARFTRDEDTCRVNGWMSVGSILHDRCCVRTNNTGFHCANPIEGTTDCVDEWREAKDNVICKWKGGSRQWQYTFGPYPAGNTGDDTNTDFRAPVGAKVKIDQQGFCPSGSGRCRDAKGKPLRDLCGRYCECE
jgi:hypothetical protein